MNLSNLIPPQYRAYAVCALVAILLALGFAGGWAVNGWREAAETERLRTAHAQEAAARVQRSLDVLKATQADRDALAKRLAAIDTVSLDNFRRFEHENDRLRDGAATGSVRVRVVGATCPGAADVPQAAASGSVDHGAGPELGPDARQRYFALRGALGRASEQLAACQAGARAMTGQ
jgi:CRISPR/Cas system-associated endoribonuclease Cas2